MRKERTCDVAGTKGKGKNAHEHSLFYNLILTKGGGKGRDVLYLNNRVGKEAVPSFYTPLTKEGKSPAANAKEGRGRKGGEKQSTVPSDRMRS